MKTVVSTFFIILYIAILKSSFMEFGVGPAYTYLDSINPKDVFLLDHTAYGIRVPFTLDKYITGPHKPKIGDVIVIKAKHNRLAGRYVKCKNIDKYCIEFDSGNLKPVIVKGNNAVLGKATIILFNIKDGFNFSRFGEKIN